MTNTDRKKGAVEKPVTPEANNQYREGWDRIWNKPKRKENASKKESQS